MDEGHPALVPDFGELDEDRVAVVVKDDLGGVAAHGVHLRARRVRRHHDDTGRTDQPRRPRHRLRVVSRRDGDDAACSLGRGQRQDLVERPARFEGPGLLEALALQKGVHAHAPAESRRRQERRAVNCAADAIGGRTDVFQVEHRVSL
jgi:hypothetical protein